MFQLWNIQLFGLHCTTPPAAAAAATATATATATANATLLPLLRCYCCAATAMLLELQLLLATAAATATTTATIATTIIQNEIDMTHMTTYGNRAEQMCVADMHLCLQESNVRFKHHSVADMFLDPTDKTRVASRLQRESCFCICVFAVVLCLLRPPTRSRLSKHRDSSGSFDRSV